MTIAARYTRLDYRRNLEVMKKLSTEPVLGFLENYKALWKIDSLRVSGSEIPFQMSPY
jgi:hypothetical protein